MPRLLHTQLALDDIFFQPIEDGIEVQRILHGARKLEDLL